MLWTSQPGKAVYSIKESGTPYPNPVTASMLQASSIDSCLGLLCMLWQSRSGQKANVHLPDKVLHGCLEAPELIGANAHIGPPEHVSPDRVDAPLRQFIQGCMQVHLSRFASLCQRFLRHDGG